MVVSSARGSQKIRYGTLSLLKMGVRGESTAGLPRSAISRWGNEDYFEVQPRIRENPLVSTGVDYHVACISICPRLLIACEGAL